MTVGRGRHHVRDRFGDGLGPQKAAGFVVTALEGHQCTLHIGVDATGEDGGDPQRRFAFA
jgi:hypothetical protein